MNPRFDDDSPSSAGYFYLQLFDLSSILVYSVLDYRTRLPGDLSVQAHTRLTCLLATLATNDGRMKDSSSQVLWVAEVRSHEIPHEKKNNDHVAFRNTVARTGGGDTVGVVWLLSVLIGSTDEILTTVVDENKV